MVPFNVAITRYIRRGFDFSGRATRAEYWWPRLLVFLVNLVLLTLFILGGGLEWLETLVAWSESQPTDFTGLELPALSSLSKFAATFIVVFGLLTFVPDLSIAWRRFHDLGRPGWLHLIFFLGSALFPVIQLAELVWFAMPGEGRNNRYGPDPLGNHADVFSA